MVTQTVKEQGAYEAAFRKFQEQTSADASWVKRLRESAYDRFEQLGFPTTAEEEWKYTNVAPIAKSSFETAFEREAVQGGSLENQLERFAYAESRGSRLVFINGRYQAQLSALEAVPEGLIVTDLAAALNDERYASSVREHLARGADYNANGFTALNTAFLSGGAFIHVPPGLHVETPLHLLFLSSADAAPTASFPRVLVVSGRESAATLIESYAGEGAYLTNAVVEVVLEENARLEHYKVQREGADAFHIATTTAELGRSSVFETTTITLGAQLSRHNIHVRLAEEGAECRVDGLYLVGTGQHTDTHSLIDHIRPHCASRQLYKGILDGKSRAVFNGKVFVHEGAQGTDAQQTNRNLLLSKDARVDTKPQLEIFADDVKCAHGATVGQLEEEELFYLISRGLHPELAQNLLTYGFAEEVIDKIRLASIKSQLDEAVLNRLHAKLEA
ncbi:MAG: Fe-S cluster assembly protein SufD [Acidobacteria bacterium]|nr:Fe-S cluster assembly protein SufD [Acidobacteriota bacterium]